MPLQRKGGLMRRSDDVEQQNNYGATDRPTQPSHVDQPAEERLQAEPDKIHTLKRQVSDVKKIMINNIEKVVEREEKVGNLRDRTDNLAVTSSRFKSTAVEVRKHSQRRNWKITCCIVCLVFVILAVITVIVLYATKVL